MLKSTVKIIFTMYVAIREFYIMHSDLHYISIGQCWSKWCYCCLTLSCPHSSFCWPLSSAALLFFFCDQAVINPALGHPFCLLCVKCFFQSWQGCFFLFIRIWAKCQLLWDVSLNIPSKWLSYHFLFPELSSYSLHHICHELITSFLLFLYFTHSSSLIPQKHL